MRLYALYGFLGHPTDWDFLRSSAFECFITPNLFLPPSLSLTHWAQQFNATIQHPSILMGYSLGGRLALHALLDNPLIWKAAIIISAHPGLTDSHERETRIRHDNLWAEKFLEEPWQNVVDSWNAQPIFAGKAAMTPRDENNHSRTQLAHALREWSLGKQENLIPKLEKISIPTLWIVGENDHRYVALEKPHSHPKSKTSIIPKAGHRVPWEQPEQFVKTIKEFLNEVTS